MKNIKQYGRPPVARKTPSLDVEFLTLKPWEEMMLDLMGQLLGERLRRGMTQKELADKMGVPQSVISRLEHVGRVPSVETLYKLSDALGLKLMITPYADRTVIISESNKDWLDTQINQDLPDLQSVVNNILESSHSADDSFVDCNLEENLNTENNYTWEPIPSDNSNPYQEALAALPK
jgi:transcriptional regulator with XRE-family HTH domain